MNARRSIPLALLAAATAVLASACASTAPGTTTPGAAGSAGSSAVAAPSASASQGGGAQPVSSKGTVPQPSKSKGGTGGSTGAGAAGGNGSSDSYAWKHPCDPGQVSIEVQYQHSVGDSRRVIVATNHGSAACGLSYFPTVAIADSKSIGGTSHPASFVTPKVPGGLGGAPYAPIYAGKSLYAVVDLDPSHSTAGAVQKFDELDIKAADFMPDAATTNHAVKTQPAGSGNPYVKAPILSLYQQTVAAAVAQAGNANDFK